MDRVYTIRDGIAAKLDHQANEIGRRYRALTACKLELQETLTLELTDHNIDDLLQFRETVAAGLQNSAPDDKRRWLEILQVKVTVKNSIAVVSCRLGGNPLQY